MLPVPAIRYAANGRLVSVLAMAASPSVPRLDGYMIDFGFGVRHSVAYWSSMAAGHLFRPSALLGVRPMTNAALQQDGDVSAAPGRAVGVNGRRS